MHKLTSILFFEADKRTGRTYQSWVSCLNHWTAFLKTTNKKDIKELTTEFKNYLMDHCSQNTAGLYWQKFKVCLSIYFDMHPDQKFKVPTIKHLETIREHLSIEEVKTLVNTFCASQTLKNAALFSCLTGLRFSDIEKLTFEDLFFDNGWVIRFISKKTNGVNHHPISDQAKNLMGTGTGKVFNLVYSSYTNQILKDWITRAGINRKITFHSFRHSYACMQLEAGTDIFTVSKMLGHSDIKTTQIYAKIADKTKKETINKIIL